MDLLSLGLMAGKIVLVLLIILHCAPLMAWVERRGSALMQNRLGPNRIGPLGLVQSIADAVKFIFKEDMVPGHVNKFYYTIAPIVSMVPTFMTLAVIPFAAPLVLTPEMGFAETRTLGFIPADLNVGLLYIFAVASLGVYGIIMASWSSNNKYALLGGLRSTSQMISYELSMGLSVIGIVMVFSSVHLGTIAAGQAQTLAQIGPLMIPKWGIFVQPIGFLIFLVSIFAETNRLPFDLPEGESEIVAGYHLEFGSMRFAMFQIAEYGNMFVGSALISTLFLGGFQMLPGLPMLHSLISHSLPLPALALEIIRVLFQFASLMLKACFFMWFFVWVRWTLPRFRYDQLMDLGWKIMLPLSLVNIFATGVLIYMGWI